MILLLYFYRLIYFGCFILKWNYYLMCGPLWMVSFTQSNDFRANPCCSMCQDFILFCYQIMFHCMDLPHFLYPFILQWAFELLLFFWVFWMKVLWTSLYRSYVGVSSFPFGVYVGEELLSRITLPLIYSYQFAKWSRQLSLPVLQIKEAGCWKLKKLPKTMKEGSCLGWIPTCVVWLLCCHLGTALV